MTNTEGRASEVRWEGDSFTLLINIPRVGVQSIRVYLSDDGEPVLHVSVPPTGGEHGFDVHTTVLLTERECGLVAAAMQLFEDGTVTKNG